MTTFRARIAQLSNPQRELLAHWLNMPRHDFSEAYSVDGDERLIAYVSKAPQDVLSEEQLRAYLKDLLPSYMLPGVYAIVDQLPLLPNGKIDRSLLDQPTPDQEWQVASVQKAYTPTQKRLLDIWNDLFILEECDLEDDFFALGGNSLLATRLCAKIERHLSVHVSVRDLFDLPTISMLAQYIDARHTHAQRREVMTEAESTNDLAAPSRLPKYETLSFQQRLLWFLDQWYADSTADLNTTYNMAAKVLFKGRLDEDCLVKSLREIVNRHDMLRARFLMKEGVPFQWIERDKGFKLNKHNLQGMDQDSGNNELAHLISNVVNEPFDLSQGPPLRCDLMEISNGETLLLISMHHIVSDGWSFGIFFKELVEIYQAFTDGDPAPLEPLKNQYIDYIAWQNEHLNIEALQPHTDYWKEKLKDMPPLMELPTDYPRPVIQFHRGDVIKCRINNHLRRRLESIAQSNGATLFMVLLTAFKILMARYSDRTDIVVGTATANRPSIEFENTIGFFANTLVLRTCLDKEENFFDALKKVRQTLLDAYAHQDMPFELLVKTLNPDRHLSHSPLFQVIFTMLPPLARQISLANLEITTEDVYNATAKFDLIFAVEETQEGLSAELEYNTDLFKTATMHRMFEYFRIILEHVVDSPETPIMRFSLLSGADQQAWLNQQSNDDDIKVSKPFHAVDHCVHHWFEEKAATHPHRPAIIYDDEVMTYAELNQRANQMAHFLMENGLKKDALVGVYLPRNFDMVAAVIATLKAGAAYVPLDHNYPAERLAYMLEDARLELLITGEDIIHELPPFHGKTLLVDQDAGFVQSHSTQNPQHSVTTKDLAYVVYTSGSTGQPKGIAVNHITLTNFIGWHLATTSLSDSAKTLQYAPLSFDVSNQEIFATLCAGGTLVLVTELARHDPSALWELIDQEKINRLFLPPAALEPLIHVAEADHKRQTVALKEIWVGGEQLKIDDYWKNFFRRNPQSRLFNYYGPSECHAVSAYRLPANVDLWPTLPPIGKAFSNLQIYILDEYQQAALIGTNGEIYIGGLCPARGYVNRAELTKEKFVKDIFSTSPGGRLYRTGDRARFLHDGNIEFMGRFDTQMKIRGFRVEAAEIEARLVEHPHVNRAIVDLREHPPGHKRLVAYMVTDEYSSPVGTDMRYFLRKTLPDYMIPNAFISIDSVPLTPNGKVDRRALPELTDDDLAVEGGLQPFASKLERDLERIWKRLLGLPAISVNDNFFDLGGHSLLAISLKAAIEKELQLSLPINALFRNPSILDLAKMLETQPGQHESSAMVELCAGNQGPPIFCVHPVGGHVYCFRELSEALGKNQGFFAFRSQGLEDPSPPLTCIESMAACYVQALRDVTPTGPYVLCGYSMGGQVAYEMAKQLRQLNRSPDLLILLDSYPFWDSERTDVSELVARELEMLMGINPHQSGQRQGAAEKKGSFDAKYLLEEARAHGTLPESYELNDMRRLLDVFRINMRAMVDYKPVGYDGACMVLATADLEREMAVNPLQNWQRYVKQSVQLISISGDHYSILKKPHLEQLADIFHNEINKLQGQPIVRIS